MKLYYAPGTCSLAPMILAEWLDLSLELERVNHRDPSPDYLALNPLGAVPALQTDSGIVRTQVDAILQYLCNLKPDAGLGAASDPEESFELHQWVAFLTGDFHPPFGAWFNPARYTTQEDGTSLAAVKQAMARRIDRVSRVLDSQVSDSGHIALGRRSLLDAYAFAMVRWLRNLDGGLGAYPGLARFMAQMEQDAGVQRALDREKG